MLTLTSALARTVRLYGDRAAVLDHEGRLTWSEFAQRVARAGSALRSLGVGRGKRYGIIARNSFRQAELIHAGYWIGAVPVPVNYRLAPPEIVYALENAECKLLILEGLFGELLASSDLDSWSGEVLLVGSAKNGADLSRYDTLLDQVEPAAMCDCAEQEDALLIYTGGTTGRAKGVRLSHLNIVSTAR